MWSHILFRQVMVFSILFPNMLHPNSQNQQYWFVNSQVSYYMILGLQFNTYQLEDFEIKPFQSDQIAIHITLDNFLVLKKLF